MTCNILGFVGIAPIHETLIGMVDGLGAARRDRWMRKLARMGEQGR